MSDFDKEAEREKLRRKYEAEQEDRAATQRMSELLLQGATMTNHHCDACGDPVFRYEGQEFCPSCQAAANEQGTEASAEEPRTDPAEGSAASPGAASDSEAPAREIADEKRLEPTDTASQPSEVREMETETEPEPGSRAHRSGSSPATGAPDPTADTDPDGDLAEAHDALTGTITRLSRRAAGAEDPRRAREFLEAAHEAAAVLETLGGRQRQ